MTQVFNVYYIQTQVDGCMDELSIDSVGEIEPPGPEDEDRQSIPIVGSPDNSHPLYELPKPACNYRAIGMSYMHVHFITSSTCRPLTCVFLILKICTWVYVVVALLRYATAQ